MGDELACIVEVDGADDVVVVGLCAASEVWDGVVVVSGFVVV